MNKCYIIAAGECGKLSFEKKSGDLVICADGGLAYAKASGINPDLVVGDFDSFGSIPKDENIIVHPREKDETDTHLAINCALERGYTDIVMYGMLGGRLDHTYANIQLLSYLCEKGARGVIVGKDYTVTAIKNERLTLEKRNSGMISVFSFTQESRGITISGLKYEVENFTLKSWYPMGVSNEFTGKEAFIEVNDGTLVIISENEKGL